MEQREYIPYVGGGSRVVRRMFGARVQGGRGEVQSAPGVLQQFRFETHFVSLAHSIIAYCIDRNILTALQCCVCVSKEHICIANHNSTQDPSTNRTSSGQVVDKAYVYPDCQRPSE